MSKDPFHPKAFLGTGLAFPFELEDGCLKMNSYDDHVKQSVLGILKTCRNERMMRPDFGAGLQSHVFSSFTPQLRTLFIHLVRDSLSRFEPRIDVQEVDAVQGAKEPFCVHISITYRIKASNSMYNLVYPFYLERGG